MLDLSNICNISFPVVGACGIWHAFGEVFSRLFAAICPLAVIALFLSMTPSLSIRERINTARRGTLIAWFVMVGTVLIGPAVLNSIGISQDSFEIAGGLFLLVVGFGMLRSDDPDVDVSDGNDVHAHSVSGKKHKKGVPDIAITPLGVPLIAGPGAVTVLMSHCGNIESTWSSAFGALLAVTCVSILIYWILALTAKGTKWITPIVLKLSFRLSGLFLIAIGVQLIMTGIKVSGIFPSVSVIS